VRLFPTFHLYEEPEWTRTLPIRIDDKAHAVCHIVAEPEAGVDRLELSDSHALGL